MSQKRKTLTARITGALSAALFVAALSPVAAYATDIAAEEAADEAAVTVVATDDEQAQAAAPEGYPTPVEAVSTELTVDEETSVDAGEEMTDVVSPEAGETIAAVDNETDSTDETSDADDGADGEAVADDAAAEAEVADADAEEAAGDAAEMGDGTAVAATADQIDSETDVVAQESDLQAQEATLKTTAKEADTSTYDASKLLGNNKVYSLSRKAGSDIVVANTPGTATLAAASSYLNGYWLVKNLGEGRYQLVSMADGSTLSYATDGSALSYGGTGAWLLLKRLNGTYSLVPEGFTDLRLQALGSKDGSGLALKKASTSEAQGFYFTNAKWLTTAVSKASAVDEGIYAIKCGVGNRQVVQVSRASKKNGANVLTYKTTYSMNQRWRLVSVGNNLYTLKAIHSNKVLDVEDGATANRSNVCQSTADGTLSQYWYLVKNGSDYLIRNAKSGKGLSIRNGEAKNGTNVQIFNRNTSAAQRYTLVRDRALELAIATGKTLSEGIYTISSLVGTNLVVELDSSKTNNGANVQVATSDGALNQKVELTYLGYGIYTIQFANSGKYLHVKGGSSKAGANIIQWKKMSTSRSQKWFITKTSDGYQLRSRISGLALDLEDGKTASGTNVIVSDSNVSKSSESFALKQVSLLSNGTYVFASVLSPAQLVVVKNSYKKAGTNVQLARMNKADGQMWTITYLGNNAYKIINKNSKLALTVKGASKAKGANIVQGTYKGTAAQKWVFGISDTGALTIKNLNSGKYVDLAGGKSTAGTNVRQWTRIESKRQSFLPFSTSSDFVSKGKSGYQNPSQYYQISAYNCVLPSYATGFYTYVSPSIISPLATRSECVEAFIKYAYKYLGTAYVWDWAMRPGQGVDCAGLVMQCLYACGIQTPYNTYDHMYDPWQDHNAENMRADNKFKKIPFSQRKRGDLIFYSGHVGIYLGNNKIINAYPPKVQIQSVYSWTVTGCSRVFV